MSIALDQQRYPRYPLDRGERRRRRHLINSSFSPEIATGLLLAIDLVAFLSAAVGLAHILVSDPTVYPRYRTANLLTRGTRMIAAIPVAQYT